MERDELVAIDRLERRLGLARPGVRMVAEQRPPELAVGEELRRRLVLRCRLHPLLLQDRDLVRRKRGVHRNVRDQIDQARRELRQAADRKRRIVLRDLR